MSSGSGMSLTRVSLLETFAQLSVKFELESCCMVLGVGRVVDSEVAGRVLKEAGLGKKYETIRRPIAYYFCFLSH